MTDQSNMQKMHNTPGPESNVQKMHIPQEWVEKARSAYCRADYLEGQMKAAIAAVIPLIREDERERCAHLIEDMGTGGQDDFEAGCDAGLNQAADWLRAQGR